MIHVVTGKVKLSSLSAYTQHQVAVYALCRQISALMDWVPRGSLNKAAKAKMFK
jgi:hypothetical protein